MWPQQSVNFINILRAHFVPIFWCQKLQSWNVSIEKALLYKKFARKMLMKSIPGVSNFAFILWAAFLYESVLLTFFLLTVWLYIFMAKEYWRKSCWWYWLLVILTQGDFDIVIVSWKLNTFDRKVRNYKIRKSSKWKSSETSFWPLTLRIYIS